MRAIICIECLEGRRLLSTYDYAIAAGHSAAYLQAGGTPGQIQVRLDAPDAPVAYTFPNVSGMDYIEFAGTTSFLFVDQIRPGWDPAFDGSNGGIRVDGGVDSTLRLEARDDETLLQLLPGGSQNAVAIAQKTNAQGQVGKVSSGGGIDRFVIRTNDVIAHDYYPNGGTDVIVPSLAGGNMVSVDTGSATYSRVTMGRGGPVRDSTVSTGAGHSIVNVQEPVGGGGTNINVDFGPGTGVGNGFGLGNVLNIYGKGAAYLAQAANSTPHTIVVDQVNLFGPSTFGGVLGTTDPARIQQLNMLAGASTSIRTSCTIEEWNIAAGASADVEAPSEIGTASVDGYLEFAGASNQTTVERFTVSGPLSQSVGVINLDRGSSVLLKKSSQIGSLNIGVGIFGGGMLTFQARAADPVSAGPRTLSLNSLKLGPPPETMLDLNDNALVIAKSPTIYSNVKSYLATGYDNGSWLGSGITSSTAAAIAADDKPRTALGVAFSGDFNIQRIGDLAITDNVLIVTYTFAGDANLDGKVDIADLGSLAQHWQQTGVDWRDADANYDGVVNVDDLALFTANWQHVVAQTDDLKMFSAWRGARSR